MARVALLHSNATMTDQHSEVNAIQSKCPRLMLAIPTLASIFASQPENAYESSDPFLSLHILAKKCAV
jgi:hypothetical protein